MRLPKISRFPATILALFISGSIFHQASSDLLPKQLHCSAEVYYKNGNTKKLEWYHTEEYVDFERWKSSIELVDLGLETKEEIYYNERYPDTSNPRRSFISYDVIKNTCYSAKIHDWPLAKIRRLLVEFLPLESLETKTCDITLGPAALLLAIERIAKGFSFVKRKFSALKLVNIDIYEQIMNLNADSKSPKYIITVRLVAREVQKPEFGSKSLDKILASFSSDKETNESSSLADMMTITICKVSPTRLNSRDLGKEFLCNEDTEFIIETNYDQISEWRPANPLGKTLDASTFFDFHAEPFVRPVGLGCWDSSIPTGQRKFLVPILKFSGQFVALNGTMDVGYVAYDGYRQTHRLDRDLRTSVFDRTGKKSYHRERAPVEARDMQEPTSGPAPLDCVVLEMAESEAPKEESVAMERLLGVSDRTKFHFLGSKLVDHAVFDLFEAKVEPTADKDNELRYNLPKLFETNGFLMDHEACDYFLTVYSLDDRRSAAQMSREGGVWREEHMVSVEFGSLAIKYAELWEVNRLSRRRQLVNRLKFLEFDWSLEVLPDEFGTELMMVGGHENRLGDLFHVDGCAMRRAGGKHLRFTFTNAKRLPTRDEITALQSNMQLVGECLREELVKSLDISQMSISKFEIASLAKDSINLLVDAEIVELETGVSKETSWGWVPFDDFEQNLKKSQLAINPNCHSLDRCQLSSLRESARGAKTVLMFCRGLSICAIYEKESAMELMNLVSKTRPEVKLIRSSNPEEARCLLQEFQWTASGSDLAHDLTYRLSGDAFEIKDHPVVIDFKYLLPSGLTNKAGQPAPMIHAKFTGKIDKVTLRTLDAIGLEKSPQSPLVGFRFLAPGEEAPTDTQVPIVTPISLAQVEGNERKLRHCQAACKMDEFCMSYSLCLPKKGQASKSSDCLLTSLRITDDLLNGLSQQLRETSVEGSRTDFETDDGLNFALLHHGECNIHAKDVVTFYKLTETVKKGPNHGPASIPSEQVADGPQLLEGKTLEECAGDTLETTLKSIPVGPLRSNFTYCPLESRCLVGHTKLKDLSPGEVCNVYMANNLQFYNKNTGAHLSVTTDDSKKVEGDDFQRLGIGKRLLGLSADQCARDCNLLFSKCLSFDYCNNLKGQTMCILYSIRSPKSESDFRLLPPLPIEEQVYGQRPADGNGRSRVQVLGIRDCSHFALRSPYLDIKVSRLQTSASTSKGDPEQDLEKAQLEEDQRSSSDLQLELDDERRKAEEPQRISGSGAGLHPIVFIIGLLVGLVGLLQGRQMRNSIIDFYLAQRAKINQRNQGPRLSHLALANPLGESLANE